MYASNTKVPIDRSQSEIKKTLSKYGASAFAFAESKDKAMVQFEMSGRRIKFILPLPVYMITTDKNNYIVGQTKIDQMIRSKWRALCLAIKAKLECVEAGITTLEQEFLAHILLPNGKTVSDVLIPQIEVSYRTNEMPPLLGPAQDYNPSPL
jgi:hypothetical protein